MAGDDPFAEPEDGDRTVIRPNPGGRRSGTAAKPDGIAVRSVRPRRGRRRPARRAGAVRHAAAGCNGRRLVTAPIAMTGINTLTACASPLFALISRIRNRAQHVDPDKLRQSVVAEVRAFENRALQAGIEAQNVKVARYALCATLDDVVLNTPWGGQSGWAMQSMVGTFHRETVGGDRFYDLLARLEKDPRRQYRPAGIPLFLPVARLRGPASGRGPRQREAPGDPQLRWPGSSAASAAQVERDLSPHWKGLEKPHRAAVGLEAGLDRGRRHRGASGDDLRHPQLGARAQGRACWSASFRPSTPAPSRCWSAARRRRRRRRLRRAGPAAREIHRFSGARDQGRHRRGLREGQHHRDPADRGGDVRLGLGPAER